MAKGEGGVRAAGTQLPTGVSTAPITIEESVRAFANAYWRERAQRTSNKGERNTFTRMAVGASAFLQEENALVVRALTAAQTATKRGATDRQVSDYAKIAQQAARRMSQMSNETFRTDDERVGLRILATRIMGDVTLFILPGR